MGKNTASRTSDERNEKASAKQKRKNNQKKAPRYKKAADYLYAESLEDYLEEESSLQEASLDLDKSKKTSSYRHVELEHKRPQLTRDIQPSEPKDTPSQPSEKGSVERPKDPNACLKVIPLGGLDAIGKNMTVFECGKDMILDDAGLMFPDDNHPGVDLILPDYTYVLEHANMLRGIVITHGHEDHTGCLPYLVKDLDNPVPIYATKLTLGLIEGKFKEHHITNVPLVEIKPGQKIRLGCFEVEFYAVNHSIPGSVGVFISSPAGNVLHTGDFKLDQTPIDGIHTDFAALGRFGAQGVDLMMSDSTNAMNAHFTPSEAEVGKTLNALISKAKGKVVIASFSSHIHRLQQICDAAVANGRKVVVTGRSMIQSTDIARKLGYLNISDNDIVDAYDMNTIPADEVVVMCTGSQGEPLSALARIANGDHRTITIDEGDTVIISATPVPGNEKAVTRVINSLAKIGADVYDKTRASVHVSGHAGAEELKLVLSIVQPRAFMPVHGEALHLRAHAELARATGVDPESIFICENGETVELSAAGSRWGDTVQSGVVYVDGLSVGDTSQKILDERNALASQGCVYVALAIRKKTKPVLLQLSVDLQGIAGEEDPFLLNEAELKVKEALAEAMEEADGSMDADAVKRISRNAVQSLLWTYTKTKPKIIVTPLFV